VAVLAAVAGITLAGTAYYAVFFAQGTAFVARAEVYDKIQTFSFANFDQFRTGNLLVRLNADVVNITNAVMYGTVLLLYAPFMILVAFVLAFIRTPSLAPILIGVTVLVGVIMAFLVPQVFKYLDLRQSRLDELNNTLQENLAGVRVGILGATGAGKSALVNLLPRFYDVTEGRILIDGVDVRDIPQDNLRQLVGLALQEAVLFQGDVRFNLKFGAPNAEDAVMFDAAKAADSYGFVSNLPEKWTAPVARRGYNFSGGQRQRLAITRTLATQPRILVLDDSTSALDVATESRVQAAIPEFTNNATTIYIAQRISAVIDLDNIVLMENGEILAMGTHEELMVRSPLYQQIYESQLGGGVTAGLELQL
jgi:ABC-type multidrug transport system fused ATPase/permease subunit